MKILAIDPGNKQSAFVLMENGRPLSFDILENEALAEHLQRIHYDRAAIEMIQGMGMAVGNEVFRTVMWIGRFYQLMIRVTPTLIFRTTIKAHICGTVRAKDGNIRAALIDRFGGKDKAIGLKKMPGPLHGMRADAWQALAVGITYHDQLHSRAPALVTANDQPPF